MQQKSLINSVAKKTEDKMLLKKSPYFLLVSLMLLASGSYAEQYIYPAKGQSPEQQKMDESECYTWAVGQSGFDPANPPKAAAPSSQPSGPTGSRLRGAAAGAIVGEIADGDTGDAALAGAVIGASRERRQKAAQQQQAQAQAQSQAQAGQSSFNKARAACLEGRGYTVK
jgi:hypothetical protein